MANLLVTGGAGFIGANFVHHWRETNPGDALLVLDKLTYAGNRANLDGLDGFEFIEGSIGDRALVEALLRDRRIDTIVNFAAETHVDRSISGPAAFVETNVVGTQVLLDAARQVWLDEGTGRPHRFHHISTDEVYGSLSENDIPFSETTAYAPNSPYSASKAAADHLVRAWDRTYGLQTTITVCSNNFGRFQFPEKLIPLVIIHSLHGLALPIFGDGMNVRDWLQVSDHCRGIAAALDRGVPGETYIIGGGTELANIELIEQICARVDARFAVSPELAVRFPHAPAASGRRSESLRTFVADRKGHDRRYAVDDAKARREIGYRPQRQFGEALAETVDWYLDHHSWWSRLWKSPAI